MEKDRHRGVYIPFRCDPATEAVIAKIAQEGHRTKSEVLRRLVEQGLVAAGYRQDENALREMIQTAVLETMKPQIDRLAAISAKATQISSASFFMEVYMGRLLLPEGSQSLIDEAAGRARQLGIEYLKLKDRDVDTFLRSSIQKITDD